jgi:hypothetical protein
MLRRLTPITTSLLLLATATATAAPGPRYASPTGTTSQNCDSPATACDITTAIVGNGGNNPVAGQEVIVEPGTYTLGATLAPTVSTNIHGVAGQPRPVIKASGFQALHPTGANALQISYVEFDTTNESGNDSINTRGATLDRLLIKGDSGGNLCQCYDGTLRDSVIIDTGSSGAAWGLNSNGGHATETLRNDTFIATQSSAYAMWMLQIGSPSQPTTIDAKNVIALNTAGGHDVYSYGPMATITMAYSDYSSASQANGGVVTNGGHNITAPPVFVDQAGGDFRERANSPTVDAGTDDTANDGSLDFAGGPRLAGAHTDIGAFEYLPPAVIAPAGGAPQSTVVTHAFAQPLSAKVTDVAGNPVSGVIVTFTAPGDPNATFAGGATTAHSTTGSGGIATSPPITAGTRAGIYAVTASAAGVNAGAILQLTNLAGRIASIGLAPSAKTIAAGVAQRYTVEGFDAYGNDAGPVTTGVALKIGPNGACIGFSCTALIPGIHTVTATLGAANATARLTVTQVPPRLGLTHTKLKIGRHSRKGMLAAICRAPRGEACTVTGTATVKLGKRRLALGSISGRLRSGAPGTLTLTITKARARALRGHALIVTATLTVVDLSGRRVVHVRFVLKLA